MKIILVNGAPGVGKTIFENFCLESHSPVYILSTIDPIKKIASYAGWDGKKTPKNRKFLSDLKDLMTEYNDYSINCLKNFLKLNDEKDIIFIDTREPEEIARLKKEWDAKALLIRRANHNPIISNHADREVEKAEYDYIIENNGTKEDLEEKAKEFIKKILKEEWRSEVK